MIVYILRLYDKGVKVADEVNELFAGELNPVAAKAQRKVPLPDGYVCLMQHLCIVHHHHRIASMRRRVACPR